MSYPMIMSLADLRLDTRRGYTAEYVIHQLIADLVPKDRCLYRVTAQEPRHATVLVLSLSPLEVNPPARPWGTTVSRQSKPFDPRVETGTVLDFEIRLNATRIVTSPDGSKKRRDVWDAVFAAERTDARSPADVYRDYLDRKLANGARVRQSSVTGRRYVRARRADRRLPISFVATNVIGTLEISDPTAFRRVLSTGIGRSKGFGCGLLCLSRPGTVLRRRTPQSRPDVLN